MKSLAVTSPSVTSTMRTMKRPRGMRSPYRHLLTAPGLHPPILDAIVALSKPSKSIYAESFILPILGKVLRIVKYEMGRAGRPDSDYHVSEMGNGLRTARIKARMSLDEAAQALGVSKSGYTKKERNERRLTSDFIRRACEAFGVSAEEIIGEAGGVALNEQIDPNKLALLITLARERLGALPETEAKNLILALISASRRPPDPDEGPPN